jgi:hypothetical protein
MKTQQKLEPTIEINTHENKVVRDQLLIDAIDEVLTSLGNHCKHVVYDYLKKELDMNREEIPRRIEDFAEALKQLFGQASTLLEIEIMKQLKMKAPDFKCVIKRNELSFAQYVMAVSNRA